MGGKSSRYLFSELQELFHRENKHKEAEHYNRQHHLKEIPVKSIRMKKQHHLMQGLVPLIQQRDHILRHDIKHSSERGLINIFGCCCLC